MARADSKLVCRAVWQAESKGVGVELSQMQEWAALHPRVQSLSTSSTVSAVSRRKFISAEFRWGGARRQDVCKETSGEYKNRLGGYRISN